MEQQSLPTSEEISIRRTSFNLDEIKVRLKKAALENCTGVPCTTVPGTTGPGTGSFTCGTSTVPDIDGNTYNTVLIGTQCWTKSNLKVTKYNDGTLILDETANTAGWGGLTTGARSDYTGEASYIATYGYLYNWYAVTDPRKICPAGWHVPTDGEWTSLIQFIVPTETVSVSVTFIGSQGTTAGGKMKATGTTFWDTPNTGADNSSGFTALPGGYRSFDNSFYSIRGLAFFWSATERATSTNNAWNRRLNSGQSAVNRQHFEKSIGASVRCLKD